MNKIKDNSQKRPLYDNDYVNTPQNDLEQINQIVTEYESYPAKGLAHGLQKDLIQNAVGARKIENEAEAYKKTWKVIFGLIKIKGKKALTFTDEGTLGLTGEILSVEDIEKRSTAGKLGKENADERLSRFLTRFESGGNTGPGSFGRGKLIFQGASDDNAIFVDSLRSDGKYIAFDRKIIGKQLKQQRKPFIGKEAKEYMKIFSDGELKPLKKVGTRITILNVKEEIIEAFEKSFIAEADQGEYTQVLSKMIEETWWEIILYGAKIYLQYGNKSKEITLTDPLKHLLLYKDNEKKYRVYKQDNIKVIIDNQIYRIKHLRYVVAPSPINEDLREVWVQRKRMKIGSISKGVNPNHKIQKSFCGYIILEPELEDILVENEGATHYGFKTNKPPIKAVREIIRSHMQYFEQKLGIASESRESTARQDMIDALNEINEQSDTLGLPTDYSIGIPKKDIDISLESIILPNTDTTRIELGDYIGPIKYRIDNNTNKPRSIKIRVTSEQKEHEPIIILEKQLDILGNKSNRIIVEPFIIDEKHYSQYAGLIIKACIIDTNISTIIDQTSRLLWIAMDPPAIPEDVINVVTYAPIFPRVQSKRVEQGESIKNIHFKIINTSPMDLKINLDLVVRKAKTQTQDVKILQTLRTERKMVLSSLSEAMIVHQELLISEELFGSIFKEAPDPKERKCEIYFSIRAAENYPSIGKNIGNHLSSKKYIPFYCGIDPAGASIFKNLDEKIEPDNGKRSWVEGDRASGYTWILNIGHSSYNLAEGEGGDFKRYYIKEQMLFHAYLIAIDEKCFKGPAESFKDYLTDETISFVDAAKYIDEILGKALNKV